MDCPAQRTDEKRRGPHGPGHYKDVLHERGQRPREGVGGTEHRARRHLLRMGVVRGAEGAGTV